jgi:hypothetical protein
MHIQFWLEHLKGNLAIDGGEHSNRAYIIGIECWDFVNTGTTFRAMLLETPIDRHFFFAVGKSAVRKTGY